MQELGHVEAKDAFASEKTAGEFQRQFRLPHPGRTEKEERAERFPLRLQSKLAAFQHGTHAGNDVALAPDLGRQMRFKTGEIFNEEGFMDWWRVRVACL